MRRTTYATFLLTVLCTNVQAQTSTPPRYALSIYSAQANNGDGLFDTAADAGANPVGGYAMVRDRRAFNLVAGNNAIDVREVARYLDPSALSARLVEPGEAAIIGQRFDDSTLSFDTLVQHQIGHPVEIVGSSNNPTTAPIVGILLSNSGGLTVQLVDGRVTTVTDYGRVTFPDLPKGLSASPTLRLDVAAKQAGMRTIELVYPTQGLAWRAEYTGWIGAGSDCKLTLSGWALIANRSGATYRDAQIKLIAGSPNHANRSIARSKTMVMAAQAERAPTAEENGTLGDYHEYAIDMPLDIVDNSLQRVALFPEQPVACQRQYLFETTPMRANPGMAPITDRAYGASDTQAIRAALAFRIDRALPGGRVRLLQTSATNAANEGNPEFVGEDQVAHTPKNEPIALQIGDAFDLRGERRQTDFSVDKNQHNLSETFALRIVNASGGAKSVVVREHLYRWTQWNITQSSAKFEKKNADTVEFKLDVPANGEAKATYTVQYQWTESYK